MFSGKQAGEQQSSPVYFFHPEDEDDFYNNLR